MNRKILIATAATGLAALTIACGTPSPSSTHAPAAKATNCPHGTLPNGSCADAGTPQSTVIVGTIAASPAAPAGPATTITDGTWTVGADIVAGTYKTTGAGGDCYWAILKTGSNGADIVNNHVGGGNLRVTLKAGQDFETERCGTWQKV